ncbi:MAG TPA: serine/threonine-protein kinase [Gemmatimonadaceae bacterium]|nr:serine/threonine-protein kinase [Gemmatimonadaceae bacterium]
MTQYQSPVARAAPVLREEIQALVGTAYAIERQIATGASAHLFLAMETALDRRVVLKVLPEELSATVNVARFRREIRLAARLTHPNIVPLLAAAEGRGILYYTMPFVEGESLHARLGRDGELTTPEVVSIVRDLARALAYAHAHGVVHRDLKPENVLLVQGTALLTDFGIAKALSVAARRGGGGERRKSDVPPPDRVRSPVECQMEQHVTATGIAVGTPAYVSPEQAAADPAIDHRTDLYSLGVVAYEMLTGQPPFVQRATRALLAAHRTEEPPPLAIRRPGTPPWLAQLVTRLLEKRPADRPQSADEVLRVLEDATGATERPMTSARPEAGVGEDAVVEGSGRWSRMRWVPLAAAAAIFAASAALPLWTFFRHTAAVASRPTVVTSGAGRSIVNPPPNAIAVLPFATVADDSVERAFANGLADELTSVLGTLPMLRIASRTSAAALEARHLTVIAIADSLQVSRVLEGTVERSGARLRITTQLTSAGDGLARWSATYERPARDLFALQDEITRDIVRALTGPVPTAAR